MLLLPSPAPLTPTRLTTRPTHRSPTHNRTMKIKHCPPATCHLPPAT
ncbi:hypothetical protein E2C01_086631 [Portunus trituberculatus]|uniref:Uncharacterized protein n=1 Tax=Portunus trituberculatus TaxID=210409 RepID=A0A5B7JA86_PORTR|nr:hypothetical protein [Portunus trituberculatus]